MLDLLRGAQRAATYEELFKITLIHKLCFFVDSCLSELEGSAGVPAALANMWTSLDGIRGGVVSHRRKR